MSQASEWIENYMHDVFSEKQKHYKMAGDFEEFISEVSKQITSEIGGLCFRYNCDPEIEAFSSREIEKFICSNAGIIFISGQHVTDWGANFAQLFHLKFIKNENSTGEKND